MTQRILRVRIFLRRYSHIILTLPQHNRPFSWTARQAFQRGYMEVFLPAIHPEGMKKMNSEEFRNRPMFLRNQFKSDGIFEIPIIENQKIN